MNDASRSDQADQTPAALTEHSLKPSSKDGAKKIKLDQFLKFKNLVSSGGEAKMLIQDGQVEVNGEVETRRGRKLVPGDAVRFGGQTLLVEAKKEPSPSSAESPSGIYSKEPNNVLN
ncbi:MAG: RNA-binding S4 domain-containing protein [Synechococcales cyanobacterium CRU_2_2]|nr:RNA-binding S4 domain-containing protein [Synechococcales cyanobacterium CRU_2_2]